MLLSGGEMRFGAIKGWCGLALLVLVGIGDVAAQEPGEKPPFVTTPNEVVQHMLKVAGTSKTDFVIDLGSGDGRIVIAAARAYGARGLGIELDAKLVVDSRNNARSAGVAERVTFVHGDVLREEISRATVVTVYLLPWLMEKLQPRLLGELKPGTRVVSHAFTMPGWKPDRVDSVRITERLQYHGETTRVLMWIVPAQARGFWRAKAAAGEWRIRINQNFQEIEIEGGLNGRAQAFAEATLSGTEIAWRSGGQRFTGRVNGPRISGELAAGAERVPMVFELER